MVERSKPSLIARTRPRTVAASRRQGLSEDAIVYFGSVAIALLAMLLATLTAVVH